MNRIRVFDGILTFAAGFCSVGRNRGTEEADAPKTSSSSFLSAAVLGDVVSLWILFNRILCDFSHDRSISLCLG